MSNEELALAVLRKAIRLESANAAYLLSAKLELTPEERQLVIGIVNEGRT